MSPTRSGEHALERRAIHRLAVRWQHELDRQVEQWPELVGDSSRVLCLRPPIWMSSPSPKSDSESPLTITLCHGIQRIRSLSSRPA